MRMPTFYRPPLGLPLRWQDEQTGILPDAMLAFFAHQEDMTSMFSSEQFSLVKGYLEYYIHAPCWDKPAADDEEMQKILAHQRARIGHVKSSQQIADWILDCLEMGIDPL